MISPRFDLGAPTPPATITASEAVVRYLTLRIDQGMIEKSDTYRHLRKHLAERFCGAFGEWPLVDIRTDHLREWIGALCNSRNGAPVTLVTQHHHAKDVRVFFKRARIEGWIERDPTEALFLPPLHEEEVNIIPVRDAFEVFKRNRGNTAIGRLALEAFGGLRYTSAGRISVGDLKFDRKGIEMPSNKHKSRKRKFRQGQPANLWSWLNHAQEACWHLTLRQYAEYKKEMFVMGHLRPLILRTPEDREKAAILRNVWRHSFATYYLAKTKNPPLVAYAMQHTSMKTTQIYEGRADDADAELYFAITPESVLLTWEEFVAANSKPESASAA